MGWLSSLLNPPSRFLADNLENPDIWNDPTAWASWGAGDAINGRQPAAGVTVDFHTSMNCAAALACTRAIAETLSTLPAIVYENLEPEVRRKARTNPIWRLLHDQPNPEMDSVTFYGMLTKRLVNRGNAFALIEYDQRDQPTALWPIHNSRIRVAKETPRLTPAGQYIPGKLEYRLFMFENPLEFAPIDPRFVLNVVGFDSDDGYTATGVVPRAKEEISLDMAAQEFSGSLYGNGALPLGLVKHPGYIADTERREQFRRDINKVHSGRENWHKIGVLWENAEWQKLGFSPEEVQSLQGRMLSAKILCQYYGVPPGIVQIFDDYKFSTVEAMLKQFVMLTIRPYAVRWEKAVGTQITSRIDSDLFLEFALEGLLRGDPLSQAQANAVMRQWGILNADEWRMQHNMNPLPGGQGQEYLVPLNHAPLSQVLDGTVRPASGGAANGKATSVPHFDPQSIRELISRRQAPPTQPAIATQDRLQSFALSMVNETINRLAAVERRKIRAAAKRSPQAMVTWIDQFYQSFSPELAGHLTSAVQGWLDSQDRQQNAAEVSRRLAGRYEQANRERLLVACECLAEEIHTSVIAATESWPMLEISHKDMEAASDE